MKSVFDLPYYRLNKLYMSRMGIWPEQSLFVRVLVPFIILMILVSLFVPVLICMHDAREDADRVIEAIPPLLVMTTSLIKLFNCCFNVGKIRKIINQISYDWQRFEDTPSAEVLHKYAAHARFATLAYSIYIYGSMSLYIILPVMPSILDVLMPLNEPRPKKGLFEAEYGVDPDEYFFEILIHSYAVTVLTITMLVSVDAMYFANVQHGCALFEIIGTNLKASLEGDSNADINFERISYCIDLHKNALSFADLLESTYSTAFAGLLFVYLLNMSVSGVLTLIKVDKMDEMLRFGSYTLAVAFSLYLQSVPGQNLIDHSLRVRTVVYEFQWYELPTKDQKLVVPMMLRSMRPSVLTAGKIYLISMENYSSVLQTAMSYFTVLSSMR